MKWKEKNKIEWIEIELDFVLFGVFLVYFFFFKSSFPMASRSFCENPIWKFQSPWNEMELMSHYIFIDKSNLIGLQTHRKMISQRARKSR